MFETSNNIWMKRLAIGCWVSLCGFISLPGCALKSDPTNASVVRTEIVTDSDESSERKRARNRTDLALGYFEMGKPTIALDEIKQAIIADPTFVDAYSLRGLIYMRLNDYVIAEESFNKALSINPRSSDVLHNLGWLKCQQAAYSQAFGLFARALADPMYVERAKTFRALGLCQERDGKLDEAQFSLLRSYEYDAANPVTGFNLANILYKKGEYVRAQFYIRRLNNSDLANAESLWLGIKVERRLSNLGAVAQLATQLDKRFPQSTETALYRRGAFDE